MSQRIKERAAELASREAEVKRKLLGKSSNSKVNRIGKTALYGGITALFIYMIYKSFGSEQNESSSKPSKASSNSGGIITEKIVTFVLAYLGKFLDRYLNNSFEKESDSKK